MNGLEVQLRALERCLDDLDEVVSCKRQAESVRAAWRRSEAGSRGAPLPEKADEVVQARNEAEVDSPPAPASSLAELTALKAEREDFVFDEQDRQLMETEQMMQNMEDQGLPPMVMQSREDIEEELREMAEDMDMSPEEMEAMMSGGGAADELDDGGFAGEAGAGEL